MSHTKVICYSLKNMLQLSFKEGCLYLCTQRYSMFKAMLALKRRIGGFSLVEMSVVLASVAAIVVMTAGGITMVNKSRLGNILRDVANYSKTIEQFQEKYDAIPGDLADVSAIAGATAGNGNGVIDTAAEALGVWQHLSLAGFIEGRYNGTSTYVPGTGVPTSDLDASGFNIKLPASITAATVQSQAIVIELAGFSSIANNLPILTPEDAKALDEKADDGNPRTGNILAEELVANDCVTVGLAYNLTNKTASCRLLFIVKSGKSSGDAAALTGACTEIGQTRQTSDNTQNCPTGYAGKVIETCRVAATNVGVWEVTDRNCVEISCSDGAVVGDTRVLSCINGMTGTVGITQTCGDAGIWKVTSSDCGFDTTKTCKINLNRTKALGCDWGKSGYALQTCTNNSWAAPGTNTCAAIMCGASNIGDARNSATACGADYTGTVREVCTIDGAWKTTSVGASCAPVYGPCTFGAANKNIGCPVGKTGSHFLTCVDAATDYWTTLSDSCKPITCDGGENIGTVREKEGAVCPNDLNGTVMEYCDATDDGTWVEVTTNCVSGLCDSTEDLKGQAYWPATTSGNTATATTCSEGYIQNGTLPTRACAAGVWSSSITNQCIRKQCSDSTINGATYVATNAGETDVSGTCSSALSGTAISDCLIDGTWGNERLRCVIAPNLWFDAFDDSTVYQENTCTTLTTVNGVGAAGQVGCWQDKSGGGKHALQTTAGDRPTYRTNGPSGKSVLTFPSSDFLSEATFASGGTSLSTFAVASTGSGTSWKRIITQEQYWFLGVGSTTNNFGSFYGNGSWYTTLDHGADAALTVGTFYVLSSVTSGSTDSPFVNGIDVGQRITGTMASFSSGYAIGKDSVAAAQYWDGNIGEIAVYTSALSTTNRKEVEKYLGDKWGITVAP